ncbi:MAG: PAS domain S-box protein [Chloroflexi bacterium]|nr:PAS domain S-box protein [Chloroflexota bacterium]
MQFQYSPYVIPLILAALISGWVAVYSWSRRANRGAIALTLLAWAVTEWSLGYALEIAGADLATKVFWGKSQYLGIVLVPLLWVGFAFHHANQAKWLTYRTILPMSIIPAVTFALVLTTEMHGLVWDKIAITRTGSFSALSVSYGFWFWIHTAYSYILLLIGTVIVIRSVGRMRGVYRRQAVVLLLAVMAPWIGNALYLSGLSPVPDLDLTPFAFTVTVVSFTWGIFGFQLVDLSPIARATVIDEMNSGMIVLDLRNRIVDINPSALRILETAESKVLGQRAADILTAWPELVEKYGQVMEAVDEITVGEGENQRWFELRLSPLHNRGNEIAGRVVTITDITPRVQAETQLLESRALYKQMVESAGDIIYRTDANGYFTYANPIALRLMGFESEAEVLGRHYLELAAPHQRHDLRKFYNRQFVAGETNTYYEFAAITTDGNELWLGQNVQILREGDRIVGFQAVARDITELKRAQNALAFARDEALEASRLKSLLLAKISHELRTPLGGILGYAELLKINAFGELANQQKEAAAQIVDSVNYLTKLVNELLDEAQIEAKTVKLYINSFLPSALLQSVEAKMTLMAQEKGLELVTFIDPELPKTMYGDEHRLHQILVNLVANAIKFTRTGGVRVNFLAADAGHWAIQVSDTGVGIPEEAYKYIFEPFRQVTIPHTLRNRGTGLGLSITKQLVELMGGQISLKSRVGRGSTFTVLLPIQKPGVEAI